MVGVSVGDRLKNLNLEIQKITESCGRSLNSVHLIAVSKLQSVAQIRAAYACGQLDFAENYVQEAGDKLEELADLPLRWHFIGRIQSNKVRFLVGKYDLIHSVDREKVIQELNQVSFDRGCVQKILLQYNVAEEESKGGTSGDQLEDLARAACQQPNLRVLGLMVMPPQVDDAEKVRRYFSESRSVLADLRAKMQSVEHPLDQLSLGTSQDYRVAIEEGANWIRVGTQIFGARPDGEPMDLK